MRLTTLLRWLMAGCVLAATAATAADMPLAVVVAPNHNRSLDKQELTLIFKRKKLFWGDGVKVQPVNLPAADPYRRKFSLAVFGVLPEELEKYWNDMYFHGISPPHVVSSQRAVLRFVAKNPGAVGYVPFCSVDDRVAIVLVIGAGGHVVEDPSRLSCPAKTGGTAP